MNHDGMKKILIICLTFALMFSFIVALAPTASAALNSNWVNETPLMEDQTQAVVAVDDENGNIYVIGGGAGLAIGMNYNLTTSNVTVYNVETGTSWHAAPMPTGVRAASGGIGQDGRVYVFGGYNDSSGVVSATQIYDIATDSWSSGTAPPVAYSFATCAIDWPYFYVMGGVGTTSVYIYDANSDSWSTGVALPATRWSAQAVFSSSEYAIYLLGGSSAWNSATNTAYRFDLSYSTWDTITSLPAGLAGLSAVVGMDGMIYIAGGSDMAYNVIGSASPSSYYYNPLNDTWTWISDMNQPRKYAGLVTMQDGLTMVLGGNNETICFSSVESIRTIEAIASVSSSTVTQGQSLLLNLNYESAFATSDFSYVNLYFESSTGIVYPWSSAQFAGADASVSILISEAIPAGSYELHATWIIMMDTAGWKVPDITISITVVAMVPISQQISDLQGQIDDLKAQLVALNESMNQTSDDLTNQINALQNQLDELQTTSGNANTNASSANTMAMLAMILALIAVILIALNLVMTMRKKS